ncbi:MAG: Kelch repeat-containing protein [Promethearchaeota archaeon]
MIRKNSKDVLVGFLVCGWLIGILMVGNMSLALPLDEVWLTEIKSSGSEIENEYDFSKGTMENVSIDENGRLSLKIDRAVASLWVNLTSSEKPIARMGHSMVYDSNSQKVLLYGGYYDSDYNDETWMYDPKTNLWTNMTPTINPSDRAGYSMVYDSDSKKVIFFGGIGDGGNTYYNETWAYDLGTNLWTNMEPILKPSGRSGPSMVYDSDSQKVILFGGNGDDGLDNETWTYDLGTNLWTNMNPTLKPSARYGHSMVYDSDSQKVILFGGDTEGVSDNETWTYDLRTNMWTNMDPTHNPSGPFLSSMVYNSDSQKVILFGGYSSADGWDNETWTYDLGTNLWTNMNPTHRPSARYGHSMVYDSDSQKVILFGGGDIAGDDDETWMYSLNQYSKTGRFNSQLIDLEYTCPITGEISWNPSVQPIKTVLELQVGFSNTTDEADFIYTPFLNSSFTFEGIARYIKYSAIFESDASYQIYTARIETVYIHYNLEMPDYMENFSPGLPTWFTYAGIGVGVVLIGVIVFLVMKIKEK